MKQTQQMKYNIEIYPIDSIDNNVLVQQFEHYLGEDAEVKLTPKQLPGGARTRSIDAGLALEVIGIVFAGIELIMKIATFFKNMNREKKGDVLIITNPNNNKAIKINADDPISEIHVKIRKIL